MARAPRIAIIHQFRIRARDVGEELEAYAIGSVWLMIGLPPADGAPAVPDGFSSESTGYALSSTAVWGDRAARGALAQRPQSRILCLFTRRWKVLRSMPAALAAAEM